MNPYWILLRKPYYPRQQDKPSFLERVVGMILYPELVHTPHISLYKSIMTGKIPRSYVQESVFRAISWSGEFDFSPADVEIEIEDEAVIAVLNSDDRSLAPCDIVKAVIKECGVHLRNIGIDSVRVLGSRIKVT